MQRNERAIRAARTTPIETLGAEALAGTGFESETPEREFEAVTYSNETPEPEPVKKYPSGFKQRLEIEWETTKFKYLIPVNNGSGCVQEGAPENGDIELRGTFEGYQEELEIKNGEFEFSTTQL